MKRLFLFVLLTSGSALAHAATIAPNASGPATIHNNDSCDIGTAPAATLLLPYFEVELEEPVDQASSTLFTVVNTSREPQIAHVTVWTDWAWPVLTFNIFLTGYDVQSINLYDVLATGRVAPPDGTANSAVAGSRSESNISGNPNFAGTARIDCGAAAQGEGTIAPLLLDEVRRALTTGQITACGTSRIGATHRNAIGYITIDVVSTCTSRTPVDPLYYAEDVLFDNTLIGDYQQVSPNSRTGDFAQGSPLVHVRAIPEGGPAGAATPTNLTYTFYDRFTSKGARKADRRQPLPSSFAARYIEGSNAGFATDFKIWREGITAGNATCATFTNNSYLAIPEIVRFDDRENPSVLWGWCSWYPSTCRTSSTGAATRVATTSASFFPPMPAGSTSLGGWIHLNLDNVNALGTYSTWRASQNWVVVSMFAEGRYGVEFPAPPLGNGCSAAAPAPTATTGTGANPIGPRPNISP